MRYRILAGVVVVMGLLGYLTGWFGSSQPIPASLYDLTVNSLAGEPVPLERYRGKRLLIVNTASKCGYTPQYAELQELHETYGDYVTVLGFPANNFLWQEPGTNAEIADFCTENYGVTFPMFEKISVRGRDQHPLYRWLSAQAGEKPSWNFCKYLVDEKGAVVAFFGPKVRPMDDAVIKHIAP